MIASPKGKLSQVPPTKPQDPGVCRHEKLCQRLKLWHPKEGGYKSRSQFANEAVLGQQVFGT